MPVSTRARSSAIDMRGADQEYFYFTLRRAEAHDDQAQYPSSPYCAHASVHVGGEGGHMGNETTKSPDSRPEEPTLNTAGNRGFKWYSPWQQELLCCSRCGWVGTVSLDDLEDPTACGASIECPQCHK